MNLRDLISSSQQTPSASFTPGDSQNFLLPINEELAFNPTPYQYSSEEEEEIENGVETSATEGSRGERGASRRYQAFQGKTPVYNKRLKLSANAPEALYRHKITKKPIAGLEAFSAHDAVRASTDVAVHGPSNKRALVHHIWNLCFISQDFEGAAMAIGLLTQIDTLSLTDLLQFADMLRYCENASVLMKQFLNKTGYYRRLRRGHEEERSAAYTRGIELLLCVDDIALARSFLDGRMTDNAVYDSEYMRSIHIVLMILQGVRLAVDILAVYAKPDGSSSSSSSSSKRLRGGDKKPSLKRHRMEAPFNNASWVSLVEEGNGTEDEVAAAMHSIIARPLSFSTYVQALYALLYNEASLGTSTSVARTASLRPKARLLLNDLNAAFNLVLKNSSTSNSNSSAGSASALASAIGLRTETPASTINASAEAAAGAAIKSINMTCSVDIHEFYVAYLIGTGKASAASIHIDSLEGAWFATFEAWKAEAAAAVSTASSSSSSSGNENSKSTSDESRIKFIQNEALAALNLHKSCCLKLQYLSGGALQHSPATATAARSTFIDTLIRWIDLSIKCASSSIATGKNELEMSSFISTNVSTISTNIREVVFVGVCLQAMGAIPSEKVLRIVCEALERSTSTSTVFWSKIAGKHRSLDQQRWVWVLWRMLASLLSTPQRHKGELLPPAARFLYLADDSPLHESSDILGHFRGYYDRLESMGLCVAAPSSASGGDVDVNSPFTFPFDCGVTQHGSNESNKTSNSSKMSLKEKVTTSSNRNSNSNSGSTTGVLVEESINEIFRKSYTAWSSSLLSAPTLGPFLDNTIGFEALKIIDELPPYNAPLSTGKSTKKNQKNRRKTENDMLNFSKYEPGTGIPESHHGNSRTDTCCPQNVAVSVIDVVGVKNLSSTEQRNYHVALSILHSSDNLLSMIEVARKCQVNYTTLRLMYKRAAVGSGKAVLEADLAPKPTKRQPKKPKVYVLKPPKNPIVTEAIEYLLQQRKERKSTTSPSVAEVAKRFGVNYNTFRDRFLLVTGQQRIKGEIPSAAATVAITATATTSTSSSNAAVSSAASSGAAVNSAAAADESREDNDEYFHEGEEGEDSEEESLGERGRGTRANTSTSSTTADGVGLPGKVGRSADVGDEAHAATAAVAKEDTTSIFHQLLRLTYRCSRVPDNGTTTTTDTTNTDAIGVNTSVASCKLSPLDICQELFSAATGSPATFPTADAEDNDFQISNAKVIFFEQEHWNKSFRSKRSDDRKDKRGPAKEPTTFDGFRDDIVHFKYLGCRMLESLTYQCIAAAHIKSADSLFVLRVVQILLTHCQYRNRAVHDYQSLPRRNDSHSGQEEGDDDLTAALLFKAAEAQWFATFDRKANKRADTARRCLSFLQYCGINLHRVVRLISLCIDRNVDVGVVM